MNVPDQTDQKLRDRRKRAPNFNKTSISPQMNSVVQPRSNLVTLKPVATTRKHGSFCYCFHFCFFSILFTKSVDLISKPPSLWSQVAWSCLINKLLIFDQSVESENFPPTSLPKIDAHVGTGNSFSMTKQSPLWLCNVSTSKHTFVRLPGAHEKNNYFVGD